MVGVQKETQRDRLHRYGIDAGQKDTKGLPLLLEGLDLSDLDLMTIRDLVRYGPEPDDDCLIGTLGLMFSALGEGSLCLSLDRDHLQETVLQTAEPTVLKLVTGFIRRLDEGRYDNLIDHSI